MRAQQMTTVGGRELYGRNDSNSTSFHFARSFANRNRCFAFEARIAQ